MSLQVRPIKSEIFCKGQDLFRFVDSTCDFELENKILVVTSKIVSLAEGRLVPANTPKESLIRSEADVYLGEMLHSCHLTIKHSSLVLTSGIDVSNSEGGDYILLPANPLKSAKELYRRLQEKRGLKNFGVLISDSRTQPLRKGIEGFGLACFGFNPVKNMVGQKDLFGRKLMMTQLNQIDAIAAASVLMMGEGAEQTPLAIVEGAPVEFSTKDYSIGMDYHEDLYYPLYRDLI